MSKPRFRLYAKKKCKVPVPPKKSRGRFELRAMQEVDGRYYVVKLMRQRVQKLMEDCNADTLGKELLCGRAIYIASFLESQEIGAIEGKEMNWSRYLQAVRALADVLKALGLDKAFAGTKRLVDYIEQGGKNGKHKVKN